MFKIHLIGACGGIYARVRGRFFAEGVGTEAYKSLKHPLDAIFSSDSVCVAAMAEAEPNVAMPEEDKPDADTVQVLRDLANRLRIHSIRTTCALSTG